MRLCNKCLLGQIDKQVDKLIKFKIFTILNGTIIKIQNFIIFLTYNFIDNFEEITKASPCLVLNYMRHEAISR